MEQIYIEGLCQLFIGSTKVRWQHGQNISEHQQWLFMADGYSFSIFPTINALCFNHLNKVNSNQQTVLPPFTGKWPESSILGRQWNCEDGYMVLLAGFKWFFIYKCQLWIIFRKKITSCNRKHTFLEEAHFELLKAHYWISKANQNSASCDCEKCQRNSHLTRHRFPQVDICPCL